MSVVSQEDRQGAQVLSDWLASCDDAATVTTVRALLGSQWLIGVHTRNSFRLASRIYLLGRLRETRLLQTDTQFRQQRPGLPRDWRIEAWAGQLAPDRDAIPGCPARAWVAMTPSSSDGSSIRRRGGLAAAVPISVFPIGIDGRIFITTEEEHVGKSHHRTDGSPESTV